MDYTWINRTLKVYEKKCEEMNKKDSNPFDVKVSVHQALEPLKEEIAQFKRDFIWEEICKVEREQFASYRWIECLGLSESLWKMAKEKIEREKQNSNTVSSQ